jgi:hypothetical protein
MAVAADLQPRNQNVEIAVGCDLLLDPLQQITLEFHDGRTAQTGDVDVVAVWSALVVMPFSFDMHEVQFIDKAVTLE